MDKITFVDAEESFSLYNVENNWAKKNDNYHIIVKEEYGGFQPQMKIFYL